MDGIAEGLVALINSADWSIKPDVELMELRMSSPQDPTHLLEIWQPSFTFRGAGDMARVYIFVYNDSIRVNPPSGGPSFYELADPHAFDNLVQEVKALMRAQQLQRLQEEIKRLNDDGAYHIRRGFRLKDMTPVMVCNRLIEESVEMQAEAIVRNLPAFRDEAADALLVFLHALQTQNVDLDQVIDTAFVKLAENFTLDESEITAVAPGQTRNSRA